MLLCLVLADYTHKPFSSKILPRYLNLYELIYTPEEMYHHSIILPSLKCTVHMVNSQSIVLVF